MDRRTRVIATLALVIGATNLSACSSGDPDVRAGGIAAAEAYVDAIARGDHERADELTDPDTLEAHASASGSTDLRPALPEASSLISQTWVSVAGGTYAQEDPIAGVSIVVDVSYVLDGVSAGQQITLELDHDARPDDVNNWRVTEPLLVETALSILPGQVTLARVGSIDLPMDEESSYVLWGYPAAWPLVAVETPNEVEPLRFRLGAPHMEEWWIRENREWGPEPDWQ